MKSYLWSTDDGKASWIFNGRQRQQQGTKLASGKITKCSYSSCQKPLRVYISIVLVDTTL